MLVGCRHVGTETVADSYTEITSRSWGGRITDSIKGLVLGGLLVLIALPVLWWNEGRAVETARSLEEGAGIVVSSAADAVVPGDDGKLVHVSGLAQTEEWLRDPVFGIRANAIKLQRQAWMYQWQEHTRSETRNKVGGGTETVTTYEYRKEWVDRPVHSVSFRHSEGHRNPESMPYQDHQLSAGGVTLGAFRLSPGLVAQINKFEPLPVTELDLEALTAPLKGTAQLWQGGLYLGGDPQTPAIGDIKVAFRQVRPVAVSVIARQAGRSFEPYPTRAGRSLEMLSVGSVGAQAMLQQAQSENTLLTWVLRAVGFLIMFFGLFVLFRPLTVLADVLPFLGDMLRMGLGLFAAVIALALSLVTIALAWLVYRPMLSVPLLLLGVGAIVALKLRGRQSREPATMPPPPPR